MGSIITKSKTAAKPKAADEATPAKDTVTVKADTPTDLQNLATKSEESPQPEAAKEPGKSQETVTITETNQADSPDDINEKSSQSQITQDGSESENYNPELEPLRIKMESYKVLYDAGQTLPEGTDDDLYPDYLNANEDRSQIVDWMVEYCVPEIYLKTLEATTYTTWTGEESAKTTSWRALDNLYALCELSEKLAERLLELGYLNYFQKLLTDQQYMESNKCNQLINRIIFILHDCVELIPDHPAYKQLDVTQVLKPHLSSGNKATVMRIISKLASKDLYEHITYSEMEELRAKMESYKALYDADQPLPDGTDDDFYPDYVKENRKFKSQIVEWMVEYCVPEIYLKTLEATTYTTWVGEESAWSMPWRALTNLYSLCELSEILAEGSIQGFPKFQLPELYTTANFHLRLLELGYLNYFQKLLKDPEYRENYKGNQVINRMIFILHDCVELIPDHTAYKQLDVTQVLKPHLSGGNKELKASVIRIISKVASKDQYEQFTDSEMEQLRAKMESYKALYDAGQPLPEGTDDDFNPDYVKENSTYKSQIVEWMVEYCVPEIYLKTLEATTYTTWVGEESARATPWRALHNLYCRCESSKILAERLLELGYLNYFVTPLTDQQYMDDYKGNEVINCMIFILHDFVELMPDHTAYNQLDVTQVLKPYLSGRNKDIKTSVMEIISNLASEDKYQQIIESEMEKLRGTLESYKALYEAGKPLPPGTDDDFFPDYVKTSMKNKTQIVDWMVEYCVPEVYLKTLETTTLTPWLGEDSVSETALQALETLYFLCESSKILAERMLELGYLKYFVKHLADQQYLQNYNGNQATYNVIRLMIFTLHDCVQLIPDHTAYQQLDIAQVLKPYLSAENKEILTSVMTTISKVASKDQYQQITDSEMEKLRAKMESYKVLYDSGQPLPQGTDDDFYPGYVTENNQFKSQIVEWMMEYSVPELYLKTLENTTYTTWLSEERIRITPFRALCNLNYLIEFSKRAAERLLELGYLNYFVKTLKDEQYLENYEDKQLVVDVILHMTDIVKDCVLWIPDHTVYKQLDLTLTLSPYLSGQNTDIRDNMMRILEKVASKEKYEEISHSELEKLRAKAESYKVLYDAGKLLPEGTDDDFFPDYFKDNSKYKSQIVDWMVEYNVPEVYLKTLETTTYTTWLGDKSTRISAYMALFNLCYLSSFSKILAERLLELGYLHYAVKNLEDQRYLENYKGNEVVNDVLDNIIVIVSNIVELVPDHVSYKQQDLSNVMKKYLSTDFKFTTLTILLKIASEEECSALVNTELEEIRSKMESFKHLYDAGDSLPDGSDYNLCPAYLLNNTMYKGKAKAWVLEYKVPDLFKKTLDQMTFSALRSKKSVYTTCKTVLFFLLNISSVSKVIAEKITELGFIENCVKVLTDEQFTQNQHESRSKEVISQCIGIVLNCVRGVPGHYIFKELKLNEVMKPYLASDDMVLRATAMMIYSSVIGEDEGKQIDDAGCIPFLVDGIKAAVHAEDRKFSVVGSSFLMNGLLECLNRIAANDNNKIKLVDAGLLPLLVKSLQTGDEEEQENTAKITWTLCFDETIRKRVINEPGLVKELERLSESSSNGVQKAAKGALWKISGEEKHQQQTQQQTPENKHIFLSYQWDNQPIILQLNKRLQDDGYKTWIDVEQMGGSTLDAMAAAVENAALVLICASEKYKLSPNCRTEGEYTYQRGKPLIPLMMQRRYRADGWLGMLMGVKLYINFDGKYEFEKAYQMLVKEMTPILKVAIKPEIDPADVVPQVSSVSHTASPARQPASQPAFIDPSIATWNNQQVMEWATKHNLTQRSSEFDSMLKSMDGKHLEILSEMEKAPEFFYKQMSEEYKLNVMAIISLKLAMKDLQ